MAVDAYAAAVARRMGVLPGDIEDVIQEVRIRLWLCPHLSVARATRTSVIDWLRRFGPYSRRGTERRLMPLSEANGGGYDPYAAADRKMDAIRAWPLLTGPQRRGIIAVLRGGSSNLEQKHASNGRKKLRRYCS